MEMTIGKKIAALRREKNLKQDDLAQMLEVSPQAVSKWENDQTCPDISLLPKLAKILGVSVDELLSGKQELQPVVTLVPEEQRKDIKDMMLRIVVDSSDGDKVRVNLGISPLMICRTVRVVSPSAWSWGPRMPEGCTTQAFKPMTFTESSTIWVAMALLREYAPTTLRSSTGVNLSTSLMGVPWGSSGIAPVEET